jgi:hypothetical protein
MRNARFQYVLTMPKQNPDDASPLFGFTPGTLAVVPILKSVLTLPQHVTQLGFGRDQCIAMRISGATYGIMPADVDALPYLPIGEAIPFWCFFSTEATCEAVAEFIRRKKHPILHVSTVTRPDSVLVESVTSRDLFGLFQRVVVFLPQLLNDRMVQSLHKLDAPRDTWVQARIPITRRNHFCTIANELTLASLKYDFGGEEPLCASTDDQVYVRAIVASADSVRAERQRVQRIGPLPLPSAVDVILSAPAFLHHWYNAKSKRAPDVHVAQRMVRALVMQNHYHLDGDKVPLENIQSPQFAAIVAGYRRELDAFSTAVAARAAGSFAPVLRLPPAVNRIHAQLSQLGTCVRTDRIKSPHRQFKENKLVRRIKQSLAASVPAQFLGFIDKPGNRIKLIGNAPLEWLPIRGVPMMIRYETSRIPSTPGNGLFLWTCKSYEMELPCSAFDEVLVVRSFKQGDALKEVLAKRLESVQRHSSPGNPVKLVDVSTVDEFISAVNAYKGAVMVFDGHGRPSGLTEIGAIVLDGVPVDIWKHRERLRVPPIVILSACDTHPIDGSHASVANAFLLLGATTVLGTLLPVSAWDSAVFISRLICRMREWIPLVTQPPRQPIRWTSVVSGLQKMSYITEQITVLKKRLQLRLSPEKAMSIQTQCNELVSINDEEWYEKTIKIVADEFEQGEREILQQLECWGQLPDTIKYIQLGNPEQILITNKSEARSNLQHPRR